MMSNRPADSVFSEGDEIVLGKGTYQGTMGVFIRYNADLNWADIAERNGSVRCHPVAWLDHSTGPARFTKPPLTKATQPLMRTPKMYTPARNDIERNDIETWEGEGGAVPVPPGVRAITISGTANQVQWAERIKRQVNEEFDRVAGSFRSVAGRHSNAARSDAEAIIAILEEKRAAVMCRDQAGYFIHDWKEISDQVRQMIFQVTRYQAIKSNHLEE